MPASIFISRPAVFPALPNRGGCHPVYGFTRTRRVRIPRWIEQAIEYSPGLMSAGTWNMKLVAGSMKCSGSTSSIARIGQYGTRMKGMHVQDYFDLVAIR